MNDTINRDRFDEDLFSRQEPSKEISYFPIDDLNAAFVGLGYVFNRITTFIENRFQGPSLADQIGEAIFPRY